MACLKLRLNDIEWLHDAELDCSSDTGRSNSGKCGWHCPKERLQMVAGLTWSTTGHESAQEFVLGSAMLNAAMPRKGCFAVMGWGMQAIENPASDRFYI